MERVDISLLAIIGGSCSGKDTVVDEMEAMTPQVFARLDFDDYFLGTERLAGQHITDWERPTLYRYDDYILDLQALKNGQPITVECHSRKSVAEGKTHRVIIPTKWTVVSGFLALYRDEAAELFDQAIYLDLSEEEIVRRRLARTNGLEGWDDKRYIQSMLIPGHRRYVEPQRFRPGVIILDGTLPSRQLAQQVLNIMK